MIDMRNGKIWGFPTLQQDAVYPVDPTGSKSPVSGPYWGDLLSKTPTDSRRASENRGCSPRQSRRRMLKLSELVLSCFPTSKI